jgi:acyl-coenzyme A synthetase/AMP-(fatty) acid ligase/acyl carrier protein
VEAMRFDKFFSGYHVYVLNEVLQQCPKWTFGNIYIGGKILDSINCTSNSVRKKDFVLHPHTREYLLRTQYMGRYTTEGHIEIIGEEDDFKISIGGYCILPHQVESELERHPDVRLAIVRIEEKPNNKRHLTAYILRKKKSAIGIDEVREFLKEKLPYYMIPTDLVILDSIPLKQDGRINRSSLRISLQNSIKEQNYTAPRNDLEAKLLKIWEQVLDKDKISIKDNFFDLGGDSLKVLKISYLIEKEFGKKIIPANFFVEPTIEQLASTLSCNF